MGTVIFDLQHSYLGIFTCLNKIVEIDIFVIVSLRGVLLTFLLPKTYLIMQGLLQVYTWILL